MIFGNQQSVASNERGFTLIEVLLASFIFMSVVTIAIGSFTSQITLQSSTEAQSRVQQTAQAIVETVSRDIRTHDPQDKGEFDIGFVPPSPTCSPTYGTACGNKIDLDPSLPAGQNRLQYGLRNSQVLKCTNPTCTQGDPLNDSSKVIVTTFRVEGLEPAWPGNNKSLPATNVTQPFVVITLSLETVQTGRQEDVARTTIRTMVTSRLFEKYPNTPPDL